MGDALLSVFSALTSYIILPYNLQLMNHLLFRFSLQTTFSQGVVLVETLNSTLTSTASPGQGWKSPYTQPMGSHVLMLQPTGVVCNSLMVT